MTDSDFYRQLRREAENLATAGSGCPAIFWQRICGVEVTFICPNESPGEEVSSQHDKELAKEGVCFLVNEPAEFIFRGDGDSLNKIDRLEALLTQFGGRETGRIPPRRARDLALDALLAEGFAQKTGRSCRRMRTEDRPDWTLADGWQLAKHASTGIFVDAAGNPNIIAALANLCSRRETRSMEQEQALADRVTMREAETSKILNPSDVGSPDQRGSAKTRSGKKTVRRNSKYEAIDSALKEIAKAQPKDHEEVFRFLDDRKVPLPGRKVFKVAGSWLKGFRQNRPSASAWLSKAWARLGLPSFPRGPKK